MKRKRMQPFATNIVAMKMMLKITKSMMKTTNQVSVTTIRHGINPWCNITSLLYHWTTGLPMIARWTFFNIRIGALQHCCVHVPGVFQKSSRSSPVRLASVATLAAVVPVVVLCSTRTWAAAISSGYQFSGATDESWVSSAVSTTTSVTSTINCAPF